MFWEPPSTLAREWTDMPQVNVMEKAFIDGLHSVLKVQNFYTKVDMVRVLSKSRKQIKCS